MCRILASERMDALVLWGYHLLTYFGRLSEWQRAQHLQQNRIAWERRSTDCLSTAADGQCYLERQKALAHDNPDTDCIFGMQKKRPLSADYNSCEVIAVYNCLRYFGKEADFPGLLETFEEKGVALGGFFGTDPRALQRYLKFQGFEVERLRGNIPAEGLSAFAERYTAFIVCLYNRPNSMEDGIHTMCITKFGEKGFLIHNDYRTFGKVLFSSPEETISSYREGKARMLLLYGITPASR